jgi:hypothetical protein
MHTCTEQHIPIARGLGIAAKAAGRLTAPCAWTFFSPPRSLLLALGHLHRGLGHPRATMPTLHTTSRSEAPAVAGALSLAVL